ncbi:hypothetical protein DFH06DRAFT_1117908 [Mycena polygramma]|nr:hypothetical protein DFH06DRAFT_1117908 [Mycena polygramma]
MPSAWLGLKARAWAWLGRALAWESSGPSPSPPAGLGLAWLGPRPAIAHRNFFSNARDGPLTRRHSLGLGSQKRRKSWFESRASKPTDQQRESSESNYSGQGLRAWLGLQFSSPGPWALQSLTAGLAWLGPERAWLEGLRASGQALGITSADLRCGPEVSKIARKTAKMSPKQGWEFAWS